ncbi:carbohydrate esterase family 16 protein, partial [Collybiopsis luxurians FD-317 M1]
GDSYTQTAFNPSSTPPQIGQPLGNPPYPGGTTTGGPNWIDFETTAYNESLILTWNYAYGGATIDASLAPPYTPTVLSLTDQVNEFLNGTAARPASAPWTSANSLFSIWIGINDLSWSWWQTGDRDAYDDTLLDAEFALVQKLYNVGARNFLFINVPPVERSPYFMSLDPNNQTSSILHALIQDFNTKLAQRAQDLEANLTDVKTFLWDSNTYFNTILDNPTTYGFKDATSFGSGVNLFWG